MAVMLFVWNDFGPKTLSCHTHFVILFSAVFVRFIVIANKNLTFY